MDGALTLAGIDPDRTPLHRWLGAAWAAIVQFLGSSVSIEDLEKFWTGAFGSPKSATGEPDRDTWGLLPEHIAGQQRLLDAGT